MRYFAGEAGGRAEGHRNSSWKNKKNSHATSSPPSFVSLQEFPSPRAHPAEAFTISPMAPPSVGLPATPPAAGPPLPPGKRPVSPAFEAERERDAAPKKKMSGRPPRPPKASSEAAARLMDMENRMLRAQLEASNAKLEASNAKLEASNAKLEASNAKLEEIAEDLEASDALAAALDAQLQERDPEALTAMLAAELTRGLVSSAAGPAAVAAAAAAAKAKAKAATAGAVAATLLPGPPPALPSP